MCKGFFSVHTEFHYSYKEMGNIVFYITAHELSASPKEEEESNKQ